MQPFDVPLNEVTVPGLPESVPVLRAAVRAAISLVAPAATDAAELVCSELACNAVRHTRSGEPGQTMTLRVYDEGQTVRLALTDRGTAAGGPRIPECTDLMSLGGRGLFLVQAVSKEWGADHSPTGTTVWSRLDASPHSD